MKQKKWLILFGIVIVIIILIGFFKSKSGNQGIEVNTEKVALKTIVESVAASGKIQPEKEVIISSDVSGEIIELAVKEGQRVEIGQLLVKINPDWLNRL